MLSSQWNYTYSWAELMNDYPLWDSWGRRELWSVGKLQELTGLELEKNNNEARTEGGEKIVLLFEKAQSYTEAICCLSHWSCPQS